MERVTPSTALVCPTGLRGAGKSLDYVLDLQEGGAEAAADAAPVVGTPAAPERTGATVSRVGAEPESRSRALLAPPA